MKRARRLTTPKPQPTHRNGHPVVYTISWGVRKIIIKRDGYVCRYCGEKLTTETHTIDHVLPRSKGGTEHPNNLVMCCTWCNKHAKDLEFKNFKAKQEYLLNKKQNRK